ncbi:MAG: hypothetical protein HC859_13275 [Bacteroidia bacterium]|nr:hypothetical protein [Bacteroidia bacterium]
MSWSPEAYDFSQLAVIAFVQNEDTREIYQSRILESPLNIPIPSVVTGIEPSILAHTQVYPNPADEQFTVRLQQPARTDMPVVLVDNLGREQVAGIIAAGDTQKAYRPPT